MQRIALAALALVSSIGTAQAATTIGFQPLALATSVPITYTESGYTIQSNNTRESAPGFVTNSTLTLQKAIGGANSGIPSVNFLRSTSFSLTGGTFKFDGVAAFFGSVNGASNSFTVVGSLLDKQIYSMDFTKSGGTILSNSSFQSFDSGSNLIFDKLVFSSGSIAAQLVLDDLRVSAATIPVVVPDPTPVPIPSAVPEPATWAMMFLGMGLVGATMRRRAVTARARFA